MRLERFLGPLAITDLPGTVGRHDLGPADGSSELAVEITSDPHRERLAQRRALRGAGRLELGTERDWHLWLLPSAQVREVLASPMLAALLHTAEQIGAVSLPGPLHGVPLDEAIAVDAARNTLGIEFAMSSLPRGRPARVRFSEGTASAWGGRGQRVDAWWDSIAARPQIANKVDKLRRSGAERTHLYVELDTMTEHGLSISLGLDSAKDEGAAPYDLPTFTPPLPVTDLWVWPDRPGDGLHYDPTSSWERVTEEGTLRAP
jgi:hypothetical protein